MTGIQPLDEVLSRQPKTDLKDLSSARFAKRIQSLCQIRPQIQTYNFDWNLPFVPQSAKQKGVRGRAFDDDV